MSSSNNNGINQQQGSGMQQPQPQPQPTVPAVACNSVSNQAENMQQAQAHSQPQQVSLTKGTAVQVVAVPAAATTMIPPSKNAPAPSTATASHLNAAFVQSQQRSTITLESSQSNPAATAIAKSANNQEFSSTSTPISTSTSTCTSVSSISPSHPQHIMKPSQPQPIPAAFSTNASLDVPPAVALPHNTPNLQPSVVTAASSVVLPPSHTGTTPGMLLSNQQRQNHQLKQQQQQQIHSQNNKQRITPIVTKYASVPTTKLANKSVISLTPSFLQSLNNKRIHSVGITSATPPSAAPVVSKSSNGNGSNEKKRSSPDADTLQMKKVCKIESTPPSNNNVVIEKPLTPVSNTPVTLQSYFDNLLKSRGYSTSNYCSLENGYSSKPSQLQMASHGLKVIQGVRKSDAALLKRLLDAGLSPNPCNKFGESIIHMICRRGDLELLKLFLKYGTCLQVCDDFGRTPLHDACWTSKPNFEIIDIILTKDRRLMNIVDCRGSSPLSYVKREHWNDWVQFFDRVKDKFWSCRDVKSVGEEPPPELVGKAPNSVSLSLPRICAKIEDITLVAMGKVDPESIKNNIKIEEGQSSSVLDGPLINKTEKTSSTLTSSKPLPAQHLVK